MNENRVGYFFEALDRELQDPENDALAAVTNALDDYAETFGLYEEDTDVYDDPPEEGPAQSESVSDLEELVDVMKFRAGEITSVRIVDVNTDPYETVGCKSRQCIVHVRGKGGKDVAVVVDSSWAELWQPHVGNILIIGDDGQVSLRDRDVFAKRYGRKD